MFEIYLNGVKIKEVCGYDEAYETFQRFCKLAEVGYWAMTDAKTGEILHDYEI